MKTIDFLPDIYRQREALRRARVWWALVVLVFGLAMAFFVAVERTMGNRVPAEVEWSGLDPLEMGSEAYPNV